MNFGSISQVTWSPEAMGTVTRFGVDKTLSNVPLATYGRRLDSAW